MSEATGAPAGGMAGGESSPSPAAAGSDGQTGATTGYAPGSMDAGAGDGSAQLDSAVAAPAEFSFGGRKYRDQSHAENAIAAMIGRQPQVQHENAELRRQLNQMQAELQALHALGVDPGSIQGGQEGNKTAEEALQDRLAKSGDLDFLAQLAEDPKVGLRGALYEYTRLMDERAAAREQQFLEQHIQPMMQQRQVETAMTGVSRALRELSQAYPELDPENESEEAQQAQAVILPMIKEYFRPEALNSNPAMVLGLATLAYREAYGTPMIGQPPGSSGAPSAFAAQAAEAAATGNLPLEGNGVPRPGNGSNSPIDRMRRENRELNGKMVRTPTGRPLGFSAMD